MTDNISKRYVLICDDRGVFLGVQAGRAWFAISGLQLPYAVTFDTSEDALSFAEKAFTTDYPYTYRAGEVDLPGSEKFASVVDLVKSGHGDVTFDMMSSLPNYKPTMH